MGLLEAPCSEMRDNAEVVELLKQTNNTLVRRIHEIEFTLHKF
jgi:hypothetical protein